jgi:hypothetical protein
MSSDFSNRTAWIDDESGFARELARGRKTQIRVAMRLLPLGLWLRVGGLLERNGIASQDEECQNEGDVEIEGNHLLEVKGRDLEFTSRDDYPYPTVIVCAQRRWINRGRKPCAIIIVSEITDEVLVIPGNSSAEWTESKKHDRIRDIDFMALEAPLSCVTTWERLVAHIKERKHMP